jgi:ATP/maltotriose-dependent transcriptional regulator MalT/DNA-binding SARP family transcriptional activator
LRLKSLSHNLKFEIEMLPQFFLKTKLLPPRLGRRALARPRLLERMRGLLDQPATIVCANAGCGKTTLVTDFVRSLSLPSVWYQIDPSDLDLAVFFGYLIYGIRNLKQDFGQVALGFIAETENLSSKTDQLVDVFVNEVSEQLEEKTIIVLDDYHHVDSSDPIAAAIDRLVQYLPDVLHLIIATRSMPNLSVTRLRSKGLIGVIDRQELSFTEEEVKQLFATFVNQQVGNELIHKFHARTRGWATGLQLIAQAVEHRGHTDMPGRQPGSGGLSETTFAEILKQSEEEIFDYFAEEVFQYESAETQDALLRLSVFNRIDPATASCVLPAEETYNLLASLQRRNLFISHVAGGDVDEYSFHPMFRRFLRRRLKSKLGRAGLRDLDRRYADRLMELGEWQKAGLLYAEAGDTESIAKIMVERGRELLDAGLFEIIKRGYQAVSESIAQIHPEILRLRAHIARMEGDLEMAERLFTKAANDARAIEDARCEASSLHELAACLIQRGEHVRAHAIATDALRKAPADDLALQGQLEQVIGNCQFLSGVATGEFDEALSTWRRGVELARQAGNERLARIISHNIGLPYAFTGDIARAREWFEQLAEGEAARIPLPQQALALCNLARADLETGDFDKAERRLEKAMELCRLLNLTLERAEAQELIGNLHRERGEFLLARDHYRQAENLYRDLDMKLEAHELPDEQLRLLLAEKNMSKALDTAEKLLEQRLALGYALPIARSRMLLGRARLESGTGDARPLLEEALAQFIACRSNGWIARARFLMARAERRAGNEDEAMIHFGEAARLAREFQYTRVAQVEGARDPELFQLARRRDIETAFLESLGLGAPEPDAEGRKLRDGVEQSAPSRSAEASPLIARRPTEADLSISMLGSVEVLREQGRKLAPDAWTLSRALRILCFIASRHNHRATKDAIVETFWPDTPLEDIDKNFWPTISYIRRALNSNQDVKKNFIRYRESAYYLNPEFNYILDTEEFEKLIASARAHRREGDNESFTREASRAVELYRGEFLEELYDNWAEEPRAYYRNIYFATLKELADHYHRVEDYEQCIAHSKMILSRDAYREDVHRQLMDAYARLGNRAAAREQYESLKDLLMEELGVSPLPETVATYKKIIGQ